jgi:hypothetical protein
MIFEKKLSALKFLLRQTLDMIAADVVDRMTATYLARRSWLRREPMLRNFASTRLAELSASGFTVSWKSAGSIDLPSDRT